MTYAHPAPISASMLLLLATFVGCSMEEPPLFEETEKSKPAPGKPSSSVAMPKKITFKDGNSESAFAIKRMDDGAKLVRANDEEWARYKLDGTKIKVKTADEKVLGYVGVKDRRYKVYDPANKLLYEFQASQGGDWKLKDANEEMIYRIKRRDYGFEIEAGEKSLYKVKLKDDKLSLRDANSSTIYSTKDGLATEAMVPLGFDVMKNFPLRCAVAYAITARIGQSKSP